MLNSLQRWREGKNIRLGELLGLQSWQLTEISKDPVQRTGITGDMLFTDWHGHLTIEFNGFANITYQPIIRIFHIP